MTPDNTPKSPHKRAGRFRSALRALRGDTVLPDQIRAEWTAWQFELEALCDKLSAAAARLYQRDKRALDAAVKRVAELEAEADCGCADTAAPELSATGSGWSAEKRALNRSLLARRRALAVPQLENGRSDVDVAES
ncbi:MAG: hypothetical protein ABFS23_11130 [Pseudomonadota bacterium]